MRVILLKDVEKIGSAGEIIDVKDGFAKNYLVPRGLALKTDRKNIKFLENEKKKLQIRQKRLKEEAEKTVERLQDISCTIAMPTGEDEKLYGEVTADMIADFYRQEGIDKIDKRWINIAKPIRHLGVYQADIKLHPDVTANIKVWVVKK